MNQINNPNISISFNCANVYNEFSIVIVRFKYLTVAKIQCDVVENAKNYETPHKWIMMQTENEGNAKMA